MDHPVVTPEQGLAATVTAGLAGFFALMRAWLRRKREQPPEPRWLTDLRSELASVQRAHGVMRDELNATRRELGELRDRQQHDASIQVALLRKIDTTLAESDLLSMRQVMSRHEGRLNRIEEHLEEKA